MDCPQCTERIANTRCEGCQKLFCLPCMTKHHNALIERFQVVADSRNKLQEILNNAQLETKNNSKLPSIRTINQWEAEMINQIQKTANKLRDEVDEMINKQLATMRQKFDEVSKDIQQRYKRGNYLENDIELITQQLSQLEVQIKSIDNDVQITIPKKNQIDWDRLIYIKKQRSQQGKTSVKESFAKFVAAMEANERTLATHLSGLNSNSSKERNKQKEATESKESNQPRHPHWYSGSIYIHECSNCKHRFEGSSANDVCPDCIMTREIQALYAFVNPSDPFGSK